MKKTDAILQFLDGCTEPQTTTEIAAGIGEPDDAKNVGSLLSYLSGQRGFVSGERATEGSAEKSWQITATGRAWFAELTDEAVGEDTREKARQFVARRARDKAADPEKLPRAKPKVQRKTAKAQPAPIVPPEKVNGSVEMTPLPAPNGRAIAVREDGAVLVLEHDVVVSTLQPEDARRIAVVVQCLMAGRA